MFDTATYSLTGLTGVVLSYLLFMNACILVFYLLGRGAELAARAQLPPVIRVVLGYIIYVVIAWILVKSDYRSLIAPTTFVVMVCVVAYLVKAERRHATDDNRGRLNWLSAVRSLVPLLLIELLMIVL